ncbi:ATP-binding cassette subfamily F protein uup [Desulfosalsimonas propionicica]|uniref:ATP-binding protein Uup n=1 Tax=Desulfosalsimonas propionicica TaxID=332175 RepID=A0A7W0C640_9BACT|nr:ATP-binding cassette domain-containing protein [Desulfosalsimonas propionicica]MBA2879898.1 ATP-binding cassette subfamily F protein uup [Desulfosalsimonas propionicica]
MALISIQEVSWGIGRPYLLDGISGNIEKGERVGLLGRNGAGKSTLLRIIAGQIQPETGEIVCQQGTRVAALEQEVPAGFKGTIFEVVARGMGNNQWAPQQQVESILSRTGLDPDADFADLSAGMKRRVLFARALTRDPDLLLLDEPTNHLDINSIVWMEEFLLRHVKTLLFVTHDRAFLQRIATRIMEIDQGRIISHACDYPTFLMRRQAELDAEARQQRNFDKKRAEEEAWIRQGVKARRARNQGRVRALQQMRETVRQRRAATGQARMEPQEAERTGKLVIRAKALTHTFGISPIVDNFSTMIMRGDKIGIIGPNGIGKTTLIRLLLGEVAPDFGTVDHGTRLQPAYFDQLRTRLDEQKTVMENISTDNDYIVFNGRRRHVVGYLQDFLFSAERCRTPVHVLSGGERNRLMLAKLFTRPANLLVLDEPTNDLDAETLELLEELLVNFEGTLLMVSHDRQFLNNVVTSTLVFEGNGKVTEYAGGYDDWLAQRPVPEDPEPAGKAQKPRPRKTPGASRSRGLNFNQKKELKALPETIEALEAEQSSLQSAMAGPDFYKQDKQTILAHQKRLETVEARIAEAYQRWEELEAFAQ